MVFITPLASTAILPATVFTPCLNWAMSGPEGSTLSNPDEPTGKTHTQTERRSQSLAYAIYYGNMERGRGMCLPEERTLPSPNRSAELMEVLPAMPSRRVFASY